MGYQESLKEELEYLNETLNFLKKQLSRESGLLSDRKNKLITSRKEMWENTVHFTDDFEKLTEVNQYLVDETAQTAGYSGTLKIIEKYKRLISCPYFGRFDFLENGSEYEEKIYIGLSSAIDPDTADIFVYDWRAPISRIFYQYERGNASYDSPSGAITGNLTLKRQYKIKDGKLKYFFDCSVTVNDEVLQEILGQNSSIKMRNIVESIQKEQDTVIRDSENELLIVQGVAGSGKTSIALHRIAFLLYQGLNNHITSQNIIIISPNMIFSKYISGVLPELGEENVTQITFEEYALDILKQKTVVESRSEQIEYIITSKDDDGLMLRRDSIEFKGSKCFAIILDRYLKHYERRMVVFEDVYYDGKVILTRQQFKSLFLDNKIGMPAAKRLKRIERIIFDKIHPLQKERVKKIENIVQRFDGHDFEIKQFSRLLSIKEANAFRRRLNKTTELDYFKVYETLFSEKGLLERLSKGLKLPDNLDKIISSTIKSLRNGHICFEDCAPLLYIKLKLEGMDSFSDIRYVVIDEAQDYSSIQYEVFKLLFKDASFTVLGDINQSIEKDADYGIYDYIVNTFQKKKSLKIYLNKSYRSSFEITEFSKKILGSASSIEALQRHENEPVISYKSKKEDIDSAIIKDSHDYLEHGYETIAILCKTTTEAKELYSKLKNNLKIKLVISSEEEIQKGIIVMPIYLAKGLEFDVVFVYNASSEGFSNEIDRKLLYIACTRALHRLVLYYTGTKSTLIL